MLGEKNKTEPYKPVLLNFYRLLLYNLSNDYDNRNEKKGGKVHRTKVNKSIHTWELHRRQQIYKQITRSAELGISFSLYPFIWW